MVRVGGCSGALVLAWCAMQGSVALADDSQPAQSAGPRWMFYAGAEVWRGGWSAHGGFIWSPQGLYEAGFAMKILSAGGVYHYMAGTTRTTGIYGLDAVMPGWRFKSGKLEVFAYLGLDLQNHRTIPDDPGAQLRGFKTGARLGVDAWYEPTETTMVAGSISASTIGANFWSRAAYGWRVKDIAWVGPDVHVIASEVYQQYRIGAHATAFRTGRWEWSGGAGVFVDSDKVAGPYARLGVLVRY